jgi:hypothetical protein
LGYLNSDYFIGKFGVESIGHTFNQLISCLAFNCFSKLNFLIWNSISLL